MKSKEFRSDTFTKPTKGMREAMAQAEVGDDVYDEDPTIQALQDLAARTLKKEAALFMPSGAGANQCAIGTHCLPGQEVIVSDTAHVIEHEAGAAGLLWGTQMRTIVPSDGRGYITASEIDRRIRKSDDIHEPSTGLIVLENSISDGTVMPISAMAEVCALATQHGIPIHLDGARLFNAALALGEDPARIVSLVDSVMCCLSKGLGAPVGSLLLGKADFIARAKRKRKIMGGGMRQAGVLAAPGIIAFQEGPKQLVEDHRHAAMLAETLRAMPGITVKPDKVVTNILFFTIQRQGKNEQDLIKYLVTRGYKLNAPSHAGIRLVTSSEVDQDDVRLICDEIRTYMTAKLQPFSNNLRSIFFRKWTD